MAYEFPTGDGKRTPKRTVLSVDGETFQVKGEEQLYDDPCEALKAARKKGPGAVVIRLSDRKPIAEVRGYIPKQPREWA